MNSKIIALTIIVFVAAISSSVILFQYLNTNANNPNQTEMLEITDSHITAHWEQGTWSHAQAALIIANYGKTDAVLERVTVREVECNWNNIYYWKAEIDSVSSTFQPVIIEPSGSSVEIFIDGEKRLFQQATGPLLLGRFQQITLYIINPGNIGPEDIPEKVTIAVFTEKDVYSEEATVDQSRAFVYYEDLRTTNVMFSGDTITVFADNTGNSPITINEFLVNGEKQTFVPQTVAVNQSLVASVTYSWTPGGNYQVKLVSAKGNIFQYISIAPS
jgi:hypothetical protein